MNPDSPLDALTGLLTPSDRSGELGPPDAIPGLQGAGESPALPEVVLAVPGAPVPWAPKQTNPKTGTRFVASRQAAHAGKIIAAWDALSEPGWLEGEPLRIDCAFFVKRPGGHYGTGRNAGVIKDRFRSAAPTGRPDLSNLVKLLEDALTTLAWADDDQITRIEAEKIYTGSIREQPRSVIRIRRA